MAMCRSSQACALESCVHRPMQFSSLLASVGTTGAVSQSNVDPELVWRVSACSLLNVGTLKANPLLGHASMSHRVMTFLHPCTRSDLCCISLGLGPRLTFRRAFRFAGLRLTGLFQVSPLWLGLHLFALGFGTEHGLEIKSLCGLSRTGTLIEIGLRLRKEIRIGLKHILRSRRDFRSLVRSDLLIAVSDKILTISLASLIASICTAPSTLTALRAPLSLIVPFLMSSRLARACLRTASLAFSRSAPSSLVMPGRSFDIPTEFTIASRPCWMIYRNCSIGTASMSSKVT